MSKVGVHIIGGVLVIPLTRGTNPCIGLAVSQDPRAPRVWGSMGHARAPLRFNSVIHSLTRAVKHYAQCAARLVRAATRIA